MTAGAPARAVTVRRRLAWPRDLVFRAWTDPEEIVGWFGGAKAHALSAAVDLRVGGHYRLTVQAGEHVRAIEGVYRQVEVPARLVFTWRWDVEGAPETLVTVEFEDREGATDLTLTHSGLESLESVVFHQGGWAASVERLAEALAGVAAHG